MARSSHRPTELCATPSIEQADQLFVALRMLGRAKILLVFFEHVVTVARRPSEN